MQGKCRDSCGSSKPDPREGRRKGCPGLHRCTFCAINPDGSVRWGLEPQRGRSYLGNLRDARSVAFGRDGTIYGGTGDAQVVAISPDGSQRWHAITDGFSVESIEFGRDGTIYASDWSSVVAINPDGSRKWTFPGGGMWPELDLVKVGPDGTVYAGVSDMIDAIRPDGSLSWSFSTRTQQVTSIAVGSDGTIYAVSGDLDFSAGISERETRRGVRSVCDIRARFLSVALSSRCSVSPSEGLPPLQFQDASGHHPIRAGHFQAGNWTRVLVSCL